jgi:O-antigen/teichoic acid export membrane protein
VVKTGVLLVSLSFLFVTLNQVLQGVFQKHLKMIRVTVSEIFGRLVLLAGTFLAVYLEQSLTVVFLVVVLSSFTNFLFTFIFSRKFVKIRLVFDFTVWRNVFKEAYPIALAILFNLVYFKADILILSILKSQSDVGIYGAPFKILEVLVTFPAMFAGLAVPVLTQAFTEMDNDRFRRILNKSFDFLSMAALPMIVGTLFIAQPVIDLIAGADFAESVQVLQVLIITTGIIFIGNLFGNVIVVIDRQKEILKYYIAIAIISVSGCLLLIPPYSYMGAAWMTVVSQSLITLATVYVVWKKTRILPSMKFFTKVLIACAGMAIALALLQGYSLWILVIVAATVYTAILILLKGISRDLIKEIISLPPKK